MNPPLIAILSQFPPIIQAPSFAGIIRYCRQFGPWRFCRHYLPRGNEALWANVNLSQVDGILAFNLYPEMHKRIVRSGKPAVAINTAGIDCSIPTVTFDENAIGRLGADHLADLGFVRLAFVGSDFEFSRAREAGFTQRIRSRGLADPQRLVVKDWGQAVDNGSGPAPIPIQRWVKGLGPPVGIFCATDILSITLLQACLDVGLNVPIDAAIVGVDNIEWLCETAAVSLSSIDRDAERASFEAAFLLSQLLQSDAPTPRQTILIPPLNLVKRRSSEVMNPDYPEFTQAINFIRDNACEGLDIGEVVRAVPISRRTLHRLFVRFLGHPPSMEIRRVQLERASKLLLKTDLPIADVALRSGFGWASCLNRIFLKQFGTTPAAFRKRACATGSAPLPEAPRSRRR